MVLALLYKLDSPPVSGQIRAHACTRAHTHMQQCSSFSFICFLLNHSLNASQSNYNHPKFISWRAYKAKQNSRAHARAHIQTRESHNQHDKARCLPPHIPQHFAPTRHPVRLIWLIVCHNLLCDRMLAGWGGICLWMCHKHKLYDEPKDGVCLPAEASPWGFETHGPKDCYGTGSAGDEQNK